MLIPWRKFVPVIPRLDVVRFYDLAATEKLRASQDPDWTAGALAGLDPDEGLWYLIRMHRVRQTPAKVLRWIGDNMDVDDMLLDREVPVRIERPAAEGGLFTSEMFYRRFPGRDLAFRQPKGSKPARARPVAVAAEAGRWHVVEGPWDIEGFLDEIELFPDGAHDDQVDAWSGAAKELRDRNMVHEAAPETVEDTGTGSDDLANW